MTRSRIQSALLCAVALLSPILAQCHARSMNQVADVVASPTPTPPPFREASWDALTGLVDDHSPESLRTAAENGLRWLQTQTRIQEFNFGVRVLNKNEMIAGYQRLLQIINNHKGGSSSLLASLQEHFDLVESRGQDDGNGMLATGYYVPGIEMRSERQPGFEIPVYRIPDDLVIATTAEFGTQCQNGILRGEVRAGRLIPNEVGPVTVRLADFNATCSSKSVNGRVVDDQMIPYWTRHEIRRNGVLANRGLELGWVANEVDLFFVEVQGSATLPQADGTRKTLNYNAANGKKYRSIGRLLIDEGRIPADRISMWTIREYLAQASPEEVQRVLDYNESFVFFRVIDDGAHGCFDYEVTAGRSVALDQSVFPANAIGFLDVERPALSPDGTVVSQGRIQRLIFNQDTGGAIKGPGRVDLFWGSGREEEHLAGIMQSRGHLFLLVPKRPEALP